MSSNMVLHPPVALTPGTCGQTRNDRSHIMKKALPLITLCGLLFAGCCTTHHVTKWEYRMADTLAEVNQLGDQGWIVVNFAMPGQGGPNQYLLKRAKP